MTTLKPLYGASSAFTVTHLVSLATDTNLLAGWSSAVQDNTSDLADDVLVTGVISLGTSPTASKNVEVWIWGTLDDTPTYPDTITGLEAAITLTSTNTKTAGAFRLVTLVNSDSTTNRNYSFVASIAAAFGGTMPKKWGVFIVHNTGAALNSSGITITKIPVQYQNV